MNESAEKIVNERILFSQHGYISYLYKNNTIFKIAKLTFEIFENEEFQYIFEPYYDVLDALDDVDIPGVDLTLRKSEYCRTNRTPIFISERTTPKNRVNLQEELRAQNQTYYNPFLLLLDSKRVYSGDKLVLRSEEFFRTLQKEDVNSRDLYKRVPFLLQQLASRKDFLIGDLAVNQTNRTLLIKNYRYLYDIVSNYYDEKSKGNKGRKKQNVSFVVLQEIRKQYEERIISLDEAVKQSGLGSKRTFYRRLKELDSMQK